MYKITIHKNGELFDEMESDSFIIATKNMGGVLLGERAPELEDTKLAAGVVNVVGDLLTAIELFTNVPYSVISSLTFERAEKLKTVQCDSFSDAISKVVK